MKSGINSTLGNIAATIEEAYNNGRVVSSDEKLVYKDFLQMVYLAWGDVAAIQYYNERKAGNHNYYFSQSIVEKECEIRCDGGKVPYILLHDYALLPYMAGILTVYPLVKSSLRDPEDEFVKMPAKSENIYSNAKRLDDLGLKFFVVKGEKLQLFGGDAKGEVVVEYLAMGEDNVIPSQIGWVLVKEVLKQVLPEKQMPVDTHEDMDPNLQSFKQRLDQPQDIQ